jgi:alcohol dehydrogenase
VFDPASGERLALFDPKTRAHAVFIDPQMICSSPRALAVNASINTFSMAIEGLSSRTGNPIADGLLMHVLRLVAHNLPALMAHDDADVRANLLLAAVLCGQGTDHTAAGITTVLGHAIGARHHIDNGLVNAIVLAPMLRFNGTANEAGLLKVAVALELPRTAGEPLVASLINAVEALFAPLGVARRLRDVGVARESLPGIADQAIGDWFLRGNPRPVRNVEELLQVLEPSW